MFYRCDLGFGQGGGDEIDPTKRGKVAKIMAIVDRHGLHLAVSTHLANHLEVTLVQPIFDFCMIEARPENLNFDRADDSDKLDDELWQQGIEIISAHSRNRKKTKDAGWPSTALLRAALACGTLLYLDSVATSSPGSVGIFRRELSRLCAARNHRYC
jgi:hypothetical protein